MMKAWVNVRLVRVVEWAHRNDDNVSESFNETTLFIVEHLPHVVGIMG